MHITLATSADVGRVADMITRAFHDLPPSRWLVPDPAARAELTRANFTTWIAHALKHGHVDLLDDARAAAVWFHPDEGPVPLPDDYASTGRFRLMDDTFAAHHPADDRHHHLSFLAVEPAHQRRGLGTAMLNHHHRTLDERGLSAFLEASSPANVEFYLESGYHVLGEPYRLPEDGPPMWPMWRQA
ncbi:GNAT family N-acetyltransferase [Lentzea tibetensis]|uniref:GNAT family N-acetyltransferase n=1 Tax=Lentzea tibetensis TaxID=2591470 RepID=A0A563EJN0_9PSEU|nr:GNAT family N-acetyltransferase [Lentzea tibetensis]TWP46883.1 GNAT family N-acetyltransferase [Lentzea tibetensis]